VAPLRMAKSCIASQAINHIKIVKKRLDLLLKRDSCIVFAIELRFSMDER